MDKDIFSITPASIVAFDDGHVPLTFHGEPTQGSIVSNQEKASADVLNIYENVLPDQLADAIYHVSTKNDGPAAWGEYVTLQEAMESQISSHPHTKQLAVDAVAHLFLGKSRVMIQNDLDQGRIHGVAVWALSAVEKSQVEYHIDYAELIRYETNIIYPPLYGGTIHCSRLTEDPNEYLLGRIEGGSLLVFREGLDHYERHGYKCKKRPLPLPDNEPKQVVCIPYRFNRGIVCDGEYPHLSTPIQSLPPGMRRVIMGFNVFDHCVGPYVMKAPEHSKAFNRRVKLYQAIRPSTFPAGGTSHNNISLETVKDNKPLRKLLLIAKRQQAKERFQTQQAETKSQILDLLQTLEPEGIIVSDFLELITQRNPAFYHDDVHVCLNSVLLELRTFFEVEHLHRGRLVSEHATIRRKAHLSSA